MVENMFSLDSGGFPPNQFPLKEYPCRMQEAM